MDSSQDLRGRRRRLTFAAPAGTATRSWCAEHPLEARRHMQAARRTIAQLAHIAEQLIVAPAPVAPTTRARGAGRPRRRATRSSARSGDSGDDGADSEPPARPAAARSGVAA
jgi:hypothetical protein